MAKRSDADSEYLIRRLCEDPSARLVACGGNYALSQIASGSSPIVRADVVARLAAQGLLAEVEPGKFAPAETVRAWLKRRGIAEQPFRIQHGEIAEAHVSGEPDADVLVNLDESPVATLARRIGGDGKPWLSPDLLTAAERLRRDFEIGRLQPRVTANWSASVNSGRRTGDSGGLPDLTDMALAARIRVDRALDAVGAELSGLLVDTCCFLKGLETVERERQWPARSAKLVLRIALQGLARHYGLAPIATGKSKTGKLRHWGAGDYRPAIT